MKVLILTEGGSDIGLGHLSRCLGIFQAVLQRNRSSVAEFVIKGDAKASGFLEREGIKDFSLRDWMTDTRDTVENAKSSDLVIIDSYIAGKDVYEKISALPGKKLLMLDDYNRIQYPGGTVVNTSASGEEARSCSGEGAKFLAGVRYTVLRREFWDVPEKKMNPEIEKVLITTGGTDNGRLMEAIALRLKEKFGPEAECVGGAGVHLRGEALVGKMLEADICVSGGGQTICELARCGVPTIAVSFADNQSGNLRAFEQAGFIKYAGRHDSPDLLDRIEACFREMMPRTVRQTMSEKGRAAVDGKGAMRIIDDLDPSIRIRPAAEEDSRDIWAWRNDPAVRKWCFSSGEISYEEHQAWFRRKLSDKGTSFFILEDAFGGKIAQVRFERNDTAAAININLNPAYIGRGYGKRAVSLSTEEFFKRNPGVKEVFAEIIEGNVASERSFYGAGYGLSRRESRQGQEHGHI